jgi:hypothetical protein
LILQPPFCITLLCLTSLLLDEEEKNGNKSNSDAFFDYESDKFYEENLEN